MISLCLMKITRLIEFDGKQHEKAYDYFGGDEKFQNNDNLKNAYALEHHIPLVRTPRKIIFRYLYY